MIVYYHGRSVNHRLHVSPGVDHPTVSDWRYPDGRPKMFDIQFINNEAEVEDQLGRYLVDKGLASKTKIIPSHLEVS